ncbi:MAG TPA: ATP-binding protein [Rhodospirillales bacterium]|nr:ATP-binding protein [Rhodospirillales bacterium]
MEAKEERRLIKLQAQLQALKLLIIDELGYVPLSPTGAELLFDVFSQRYGAAASSSPPICRSTSGPASLARSA